MSRFLLRAPMLAVESLRGYSLRMAALNDCPGVVQAHLCSLAAITEAIPMMASLTSVEEAILSMRLSSQPMEGEGRKRVARVGSSSLGWAAVRWQERLVCPACVERGVFSSILWELQAYECCERHRLWLVRECSGCRRPLDWQSTSLDRCSCGQPLAGLARKEAPRAEVRLSRQLTASALESLGDRTTRIGRTQRHDLGVPLDSMLLFLEYGFCLLPQTGHPGSQADTGEDPSTRLTRKLLAEAICERPARLAMCGRFSEIELPIVLGGKALSERSMLELKWMFAGAEPSATFPLREHLADRRRRWQGIAPALVEAKPFERRQQP